MLRIVTRDCLTRRRDGWCQWAIARLPCGDRQNFLICGRLCLNPTTPAPPENSALLGQGCEVVLVHRAALLLPWRRNFCISCSWYPKAMTFISALLVFTFEDNFTLYCGAFWAGLGGHLLSFVSNAGLDFFAGVSSMTFSTFSTLIFVFWNFVLFITCPLNSWWESAVLHWN